MSVVEQKRFVANSINGAVGDDIVAMADHVREKFEPGSVVGVLGYGSCLRGVSTADSLIDFYVLVGDAPYYSKVGFKQVPEGQMIMPGPNDPDRLLYLELQQDALAQSTGLIRSPHRYRTARYRTAPFRNNPGSR